MKFINEADHLVVEFASLMGNERSFYPLSKETQLWLVRECTDTERAPVWKAIGKLDWQYSLMASICSEQVIQAEFKERLVAGASMSAEQYIAEWRAACAKAIPLGQLGAKGLTVSAVFSKPLAGVQAMIFREPTGGWEQALRSLYAKISDTTVTWTIPLLDAAACLEYSKVAALYLSTSDYPEQSLEIVVACKAETPRHLVTTLDLFEREEAAA